MSPATPKLPAVRLVRRRVIHPSQARIAGIGATLLLLAQSPGVAQAPSSFAQQAYLGASTTPDRFGYAVANSGDTAVVGAPFDSSNFSGSAGAAYVFARTDEGWSEPAFLRGSNTNIADNFGHAVAIEGDTIVVGAPFGSGLGSIVATGAAYVFVRNGTMWIQQAVLTASNAAGGDQFGVSVAISGNTVVVGAHKEASASAGVGGNQGDNSALDAGAAYVFLRSGTTWTQQAYLKASNPDATDFFAFSVGISGDIVVVGAPQEDSNAQGIDGDQSNNSASIAGAAYVFARTGTIWTQQAYLKGSNTRFGDQFGYAVAVSGSTVAIGARFETSLGTGVNGDQTTNKASGVGAVYVFERIGGVWGQEAYVKASHPGANDRFGHSVALAGNVLVVGAPEEDSSASGVNGDGADNSLTGAGAAYVYVRSGGLWSYHSYLKASDPGLDDGFGYAVSASASTILVGAVQDAIHVGAAYVFHRPNTAPTIATTAISRWPATAGSFEIAVVDDEEDGAGLLEVSVESDNPSNGVTLSGINNTAGSVTAWVDVASGATSASFVIRVTDVWGGTAEGSFDVTVVPPVSITPVISPAPNGDGWHNGPVTVSWGVAHATAQTGCDPIVLSTETTLDGTVVTCIAANAGGSSSESVTLRIDLTPPTGTVTRSPAANASGWANTDVTVSYTCSDALSGAVAAGAAETINTEGAGQSSTFLCFDRAGNSLPLSMVVNIDKTPPVVVPGSVIATPNPATVNTVIGLAATLSDAGSSGLERAEFRLGSAAHTTLSSAAGTGATVSGSIGAFATPTVVEACVRAVDLAGNAGDEECLLIAVFDPAGGYVTGAGTIDSPQGALAGSSAAGAARFGFQSKYAKGAMVPSGNTQFRFRAGDFEFDSTAYQWLVVSGARAQYKGTGVIRNRTGTFDFMLSAIDGDQPGGDGLDRFRLKITDADGLVVYDNQTGAEDTADPATAVASGHIVIRK